MGYSVAFFMLFFAAVQYGVKERSRKKKVTPQKEASSRLPLVRIVIGNMKTFLNGMVKVCQSSIISIK
jgi:hypothetical protein